MKRTLLLAVGWALAAGICAGGETRCAEGTDKTPAADVTDVTFLMCYRPEHPEDPSTKALLAFSAAHPEVRPLPWGGLTLPGGGGRAQFTLAMAGGTAPDVYKAWFHILRHDIDEGFCYPLNEWIGDDWPGWKDSPPLWKEVATKDGRIYAVPTPGVAYYGILYRRDLVKQAGLDPDRPPATWDAFEDWCRRLTKPGRRAFAIENRPWGFLPWVGAAGGDVIRRRPGGGPDDWEAAFDSPAALRAAAFIQRLVRADVVRAMPVLSLSSETAEMFARGEIASVFGGEDLVAYLTETLDFPPDLIGLMPFPAADAACRPVLQAHKHFYAMTESVAHRPKRDRDRVWAALAALASRHVYDDRIRADAAAGRARWCRPADLKRLGLDDCLDDVPAAVRRMYDDLDAGRIATVTEPYMGFWQGASDLVQRRFLGILLSDFGKTFDCAAALAEITKDANRGLMFDADRSCVAARRPIARTVAGIGLITLLAVWFVLWRNRARGATAAAVAADATETDGPRRRLAPILFLAPAVLSVAVWSYYPLVKGAVMAFQDYRIAGGTTWTGLDNFIRVATDPGFWKGWLRTLEYAGITLALGFTAPILLAVMLTEIPRGRIFFRTVYFLPHLTSALVVTLLWKLMYDPTEGGMLNQILAVFGLSRQAWLQDPAWAMACCIVPGVWAGAGIASLVYIAALGSLPADYYEAAAIDGAGFFARLRHVTLPQLMPLMVINFTGAFIASFQGMGSIFLLTFGGPGDATNVLSLAIWKEAYNNLRFSTATTMAWFLGTALVGATCLQVRFLRKVEFRSAAAN